MYSKNKTSFRLRDLQLYELALIVKQCHSYSPDPYGVTFSKSAWSRSGISEEKDKESQLNSFPLEGVTIGITISKISDNASQICWRHHICFPGPPFQQFKSIFQCGFDSLPKLSCRPSAEADVLLTIVTLEEITGSMLFPQTYLCTVCNLPNLSIAVSTRLIWLLRNSQSMYLIRRGAVL